MEQIYISAIQLDFLEAYFADQFKYGRKFNNSHIIKASARVKFALELRKYVNSDTAVHKAVTSSDLNLLKKIAAAPVKYLFGDGRNKQQAVAMIKTATNNYKELQTRSKNMIKLLPQLLKNSTNHTTTAGVLEFLHGPIPVTIHEITTPNGYYKFSILE